MIGIAAIFWMVGMAIWCAMGVIVANPPDGSKWSSAASFPIPYHNVESLISVPVSMKVA